ncbi:MAG: hypothetical protein M4579_000372 [Chaenotheca gracillima]|nr:MAG: hypothetical protein M4579_000372 [Chaenotheca gracillima]
MDKLLSQLLAFPPPEGADNLTDSAFDSLVKDVVNVLQRTPASALTSETEDGGTLLQALDPRLNSVPYLYVLLAQSNSQQSHSGKTSSAFFVNNGLIDPMTPLWANAVHFLQKFDSRQIRYVGHEFRRLVDLIAKSAKSFGKPLLAVHPVRSAILRLDASSETFTSTHTLFASLCLQARAFRAALPILDKDILGLPSTPPAGLSSLPSATGLSSLTYITESSGLSATLNYTDLIEYHLHGAMIYIGLKNWERAYQFLSLVIATPTQNVASSPMVEAYKKWTLVSLLLSGQAGRMPKTANPTAIKSFHAIGKPYETIAEAFKAGDAMKLQQEVEAGRDIWKEDNNRGLIDLVVSALPRFAIHKLESIYSTLSIAEIHHRLHPTELSRSAPSPADLQATESQILSMIASGTLNATLSQPSSSSESPTVLHFSPTQLSEDAQLAQVEEQIQRTIQVTNHIRAVDRRMANSKEYLSWLSKARQAAKKAGASGNFATMGEVGGQSGMMAGGMGGDAMDMEWGENGYDIMDEDMMAGIQGGESGI